MAGLLVLLCLPTPRAQRRRPGSERQRQLVPKTLGPSDRVQTQNAYLRHAKVGCQLKDLVEFRRRTPGENHKKTGVDARVQKVSHPAAGRLEASGTPLDACGLPR
jgi:hypothetical protein